MILDEHGRRVRRRLKVGFLREYIIEADDQETGDSYTYAVSANRVPVSRNREGAEAIGFLSPQSSFLKIGTGQRSTP